MVIDIILSVIIRCINHRLNLMIFILLEWNIFPNIFMYITISIFVRVYCGLGGLHIYLNICMYAGYPFLWFLNIIRIQECIRHPCHSNNIQHKIYLKIIKSFAIILQYHLSIVLVEEINKLYETDFNVQYLISLERTALFIKERTFIR